MSARTAAAPVIEPNADPGSPRSLQDRVAPGVVTAVMVAVVVVVDAVTMAAAVAVVA